MTKTGHTYTPDNGVKDYKHAILLTWKSKKQPKIETAPIMLGVYILMPRPKSKGKGGRLWHTSRPDIDNLTKAVMDALNGHAWHDDSQICFCTLSKRICSAGENPMTEILISEIHDDIILYRGYPWKFDARSGASQHECWNFSM